MDVSWVKCTGNKWCELNTVNLQHASLNNLEGVYVIWHGGSNPATVRVGQGRIRDRLAAHRQDREIQAYASLELYVTWARVDERYQDGVEAYLAQQLRPKVGERFPERTPIPVNLPW